jgi:hypothetical protein
MTHPARRIRAERRAFLKALGGVGAVTAATSLFPWLRARSQDAAAHKKLVLYYTPHGTIWDQWRPTGGETDFELSHILEPLAAHRDRLAIIDGLQIAAPYEHRVPHTYDMPAIFTGSPIDVATTTFYREDHDVSYGWNTGVSIDQTIASRLALTTPVRTLELGTQSGGSHPASRMIYTGPAEPRQPLDHPSLAWEQVFRDATQPEPDTSQLARRTAILDTVIDDLHSLSPTLGASDRRRLDAHATALAEIEAGLAPIESACELPAQPEDGNLDVEIDRQGALIAAALACGQTRIASLQVTKADNDGALYPWVGIDSGGHHTLSHDSSAGATTQLTGLYRWYAERFAQFLDALAATPDIDGTSVLDNTFVLWASEIGVGWTHDVANVPFIVAGGGAHGVRGGRYLQPTGQRHNRLLVSAAHYMGLTDIASYGDMDDAEGPLAGLLG